MKILSHLLILLLAVLTISANAALYDRGNGMIYDSTQNITWLQDANYGYTSGALTASFGRLPWIVVTNWVANLSYGGFDDWRLPSAKLNGSNYDCTDYLYCPSLYNGTFDSSYNNTRSEIGHLFSELGSVGYYDTHGKFTDNNQQLNSSFTDAQTGRVVNFINLHGDAYWEMETYESDFYTAWLFHTGYGVQSTSLKVNDGYGWAVRDGDVFSISEVPVPAAVWLMGSGLIGLAGIARRKK